MTTQPHSIDQLPTYAFDEPAISEAQEMLGEIAQRLKPYEEYSPADITALRSMAASPELTDALLQDYRKKLWSAARQELSRGYPWAMQVFERVGSDPLELIHERNGSGMLIHLPEN